MLIQLSHLKALGYPSFSKKVVPPLPDDIVAQAGNGAMVVTFRPLRSGWPDKRVKKISAVERFLWIKGESVILYGLETDTPLAPLILWDVAHAAQIGSNILLLGDNQQTSFLERNYFSAGLELVESGSGKRVFRKVRKLSAELDSGLDAWSFGIPVGPEDATLLNVTVKRILDLDIPKKEILLCGRPGANFKYFNHVRIVGEDITAPPVKICAKKNRLAKESSHPNLCIIHDRVFLPRDFYKAINKFGDCYPLTTFQSIFFDDKFNLIPRRYSDFGVSYKAKSLPFKGLMRDNEVERPSIFSPGILAVTERAGFYSGNALRFTMGNYPTGSMYLCKRSIWNAFPQNENLNWIEFEDLEHAYRACDGGVPSRVNPYALTQSLISRPLLARVVGSVVETVKGYPRLMRTWSEFLPVPRKPAIKVTHDGALAGMRRFAEKYIPSGDEYVVPVAAALRSRNRLETIIEIISRSQVPLRESVIREFIRDFEKMLVLDQLPYSWIELACLRLLIDRASPVRVMVEENDMIYENIANRPGKNVFCASLDEYLQSNNIFVGFGTLISAFYLYFKRKQLLYIRGGPFAYVQAIRNSTPFKRMV